MVGAHAYLSSLVLSSSPYAMSILNVGGSGDRTLTALLRGLRNGVFGTLAVLQKKETPRKPWLVYLLATVQFFQMFHFVRVPRRRLPSPPSSAYACSSLRLPLRPSRRPPLRR